LTLTLHEYYNKLNPRIGLFEASSFQRNGVLSPEISNSVDVHMYLNTSSLILLSSLLATMAQETPNTTHPLPRRIDVHSHFLPPFYRTALAENGHSKPDGMPAIPEWSLEQHLSMMSTANVSKSILSISSPGTHIAIGNDTFGIHLTRECNAHAAQIKKDNPEKFGYWAALPLPNVDAALAEIEKSWKDGADGFGLMTNYHGVYLGNPTFDPVFTRLNELGATVFIHPTAPCMKEGTLAGPLDALYPTPIFEFFFDTARTVINLFYTRTIDRCPNMRFVIPHAGGALPPLMTRFVQFSSVVPGTTALNAATVRRQLDTQFYFDLAGFVFDGDEEAGGSGQLKAFVEGFGVSHERLLFGSDFPFTGEIFVKVFAERMRGGLEALFGEEERARVYVGNAERLLGERKYES
jgi:predicted TIM-barrel fold metal-dependent hydrolase